MRPQTTSPVTLDVLVRAIYDASHNLSRIADYLVGRLRYLVSTNYGQSTKGRQNIGPKHRTIVERGSLPSSSLTSPVHLISLSHVILVELGAPAIRAMNGYRP